MAALRYLNYMNVPYLIFSLKLDIYTVFCIRNNVMINNILVHSYLCSPPIAYFLKISF